MAKLLGIAGRAGCNWLPCRDPRLAVGLPCRFRGLTRAETQRYNSFMHELAIAEALIEQVGTEVDRAGQGTRLRVGA